MCGCFCLKGLNTLQSLKELNLADNIIEKIGRFIESFLFSVPSLIEIHCAEKNNNNHMFFNFF